MHAYNVDSISQAEEDNWKRTECPPNQKIYELAYHLNIRAGELMLQERRQSIDDEWILFPAPLTSSLSWKVQLWGKFRRIAPFLEDM